MNHLFGHSINQRSLRPINPAFFRSSFHSANHSSNTWLIELIIPTSPSIRSTNQKSISSSKHLSFAKFTDHPETFCNSRWCTAQVYRLGRRHKVLVQILFPPAAQRWPCQSPMSRSFPSESHRRSYRQRKSAITIQLIRDLSIMANITSISTNGNQIGRLTLETQFPNLPKHCMFGFSGFDGNVAWQLTHVQIIA